MVTMTINTVQTAFISGVTPRLTFSCSSELQRFTAAAFWTLPRLTLQLWPRLVGTLPKYRQFLTVATSRTTWGGLRLASFLFRAHRDRAGASPLKVWSMG